MKMRKLVSLVLALVMVLGIALPAMAAEQSAQETAGGRLLSLGVIEGYTDGTLGLDRTITRAEICVIIAKICGMGEAADLLKDTPSKFSDVKTGQWYTGWINLASSQGWVVGDPQGTFRPNDPVSYREIVTMLLKALGYDDNLPGDWPTNFLAKAAALGITKGIVSDSKAPAVRGDVFIMTSRTLDEEVVKFDKDTGKFEESGKTLLVDKMGLEKVEGVVTDIPRIGLDDDEIEIDGKVYDVAGNVDYNAVFGAEVTAWLNDDDEVVFVDIESDNILYDAIKFNKADEEIELIGADKEYDLADDVTIFLNAKDARLKDVKENDDYEYAKVVLNDKGDVVFIDAYNWDGFLVVDSVDDDVIYGLNDDDLDAEDYSIVKDGKTISLDDLEEGDILYYNNGKGVKFAEVYNASYVGTIDRVYGDDDSGSIKIDGEELDIVTRSVYRDGKDLEPFTHSIADDMRKEGEEATVYVDRFGKIAFVIGDTGAAETSSFYAFVLENSKFFTNRGDESWTLEVISETGKELSYDLDEDVDGNWKTDITFDGSKGDDDDDEAPAFSAGDVVEIEVDADGAIEAVNVKSLSPVTTSEFKTDAKYVDGKKLQNSAVIFDIADAGPAEDDSYDADDILVTTLGEFKASKITDSSIVVDSNHKVVVIVVSASDREGDEDYDAVLVADPKKVSGKEEYRLDLNINGKEDTYYTASKRVANDAKGLKKGAFVKVTVDEENKEITDLDVIDGNRVISDLVISEVIVSNSRIKVGSDTYRLSDAVLLDSDYDAIRIRDLAEGDTVKVLLVAKGSEYVSYLVVTAEADSGSGGGSGDVDKTTYIVTDYTAAFGRLALEDVDTNKSTRTIDSFDAVFFNDVEVSKTVMKAWFANKFKNEAEVVVEITEDNVLVVKETPKTVDLDDDTVAVFSQEQLETALTEGPEVIELYGEFKGFKVERPVTITGNAVVKGKLTVSSPGVVVDGLTIDSDTHPAVAIIGSASDVKLLNNKINAKGNAGIGLNRGTGGIIEGNTITARKGIVAQTDVELTIKNNVITSDEEAIELFYDKIANYDNYTVENNVNGKGEVVEATFR